jgi:hypothetical protein
MYHLINKEINLKTHSSMFLLSPNKKERKIGSIKCDEDRLKKNSNIKTN